MADQMDDFSQIVVQYLDLVYAAARRQVRDAELAEDVTQAVFIIFAQKHKTIPANHPLSAWLLKTTTYCAANARRAQNTRHFHEQKAGEMARNERHDAGGESDWQELSPLLDEGLNKLRSSDRDAVLLKYFEKKTLRQVGDALGISEEAAGKRVARAVEKLRDFFRRRGVTVSAAALGTMLLAQSTHAAPAGLAAAVASSTSAAATTAATTTSAGALAKGAMVVMAAEKTKALVAAAVVMLIGVGGAAVAVKTVIGSSSSRTRTVSTITPPKIKISERPLVPVMNTPNWDVRLPSGRMVEVLGISDLSTTPITWWLPDGSPTSDPQISMGEVNTLPRPPRTRQVHIVLRSHFSDDERVMYSLRQQSYISSRSLLSIGSRVHHLISTVPENLSRGTLAVGCGFGPWDTQVTYDLRPGAPATQPARAPRIINVTSQGSSTIVRMTVPATSSPLPVNEEFVLVKPDGQIVQSTSGLFQNDYREFTFPIAASDASYALYRARPYEIVELSNVALRPSERTDVSEAIVFERKIADVATTQPQASVKADGQKVVSK